MAYQQMYYTQAIGIMATHNRDNMKTFEKSFIKNQSAMEYLMTYGWSILIVAVVLGALSFLGVFNPLTFAPKATAGNCQVVKNAQLGVSNLVGSCNNQVPQYVASLNGIDSNVNTTMYTNGTTALTISAWLYPQSNAASGGIGNLGSCPDGANIEWRGNSFNIEYTMYPADSSNSCANNQLNTSKTLSIKTWYFVTFVFNGTGGNLYLNGISEDKNNPASAVNSIWGTRDLYVGRYYYGYFNGYISNVQVYNTPLSNSSVLMLYQEGIGGVPIDPKNIVAWYPLNGNANDYSGNQRNGIPTNLIYTNNWYNGYSQP